MSDRAYHPPRLAYSVIAMLIIFALYLLAVPLVWWMAVQARGY